MADSVTIKDAHGATEYHGWSVDPEGRIYPLTGYMAADGVKVPESSPYGGKPGAFFWRADATVTDGLLKFEDFEGVKPTVGSDNLQARLGLFIFDKSTKRMVAEVTGFTSFWLSDDEAEQDLQDIRLYNIGAYPATPPVDFNVSGNLTVGLDANVAGDGDFGGNLDVAGRGTFGAGVGGILESDVPNLPASKITSGTLADARIASAATWNAKQNALGFTPRNAALDTVDTFNGREGAVTLLSSDLNGLSGAGLTGIGVGVSTGHSAAGSVTISADTDADGLGVVDLQTRNLSRLRVGNNGRFDLFRGDPETNVFGVDEDGNVDLLTFTAEMTARLGLAVTPVPFGAHRDSASHPITSGDIAAHPEWVGTYDEGDEWDYVALMEAYYAAFCNGTTTPNGSNRHLNRPLYIPEGIYIVNKPWMLTAIQSGRIYGAGKLSTVIRNITVDSPAVQTNGFWYTHVSGILFQTAAAISGKGVFELDGNYGLGGVTQGTQGCAFDHCYFDAAGLADYAITLGRLSSGAGQGSEHAFRSCHFDRGLVATYYQQSFNALNNKLVDCNFQGHQKDGVLILAGSIKIDNTAFQSTYAYQQILNGGYDINASTGGVGERIVVIGCDSESWAFYKGAGSQVPILLGNNQRAGGNGGSGWSALTPYALDLFITKVDERGEYQIWQVTTAGTSGASQPDWTGAGTTRTDGSVTWTKRVFRVVDAGVIVDLGNKFQTGLVYVSAYTETEPERMVTSDYTASFNDETIIVDAATTGPVTITLPVFGPFPGARPFTGKWMFVKSMSNYAVSVVGDNTAGPDHNLSGALVIPGGSKGFLLLRKGNGNNPGEVWYIAAKSLGLAPKGANIASAATIIPTGSIFHVTGTTNISSIDPTGIAPGTEITMIFDDVLTVSDTGSLRLAGSFTTSAFATLKLMWDGGDWLEIARSSN